MCRLLTAEEVADRLHISRSLAYREIRLHMLHAVVGDRGLRVSEAALAAYIERRTCSPTVSISERRRTGAGTTMPRASGSAAVRSVVTGEQPKPPSNDSSAKPRRVRPIQ